MNNIISNEASKELSQRYSSDSNLKLLVDWLATKQNDSRILKARVAAYRTERSEPEMREVFKIFRDLGLGTYITGRKGGETRFVFDYSSRSLQSSAKQGKPVQPIDDRAAEYDAKDEEQEVSQDDLLEHSFNLRSDFVVRLILPRDFTSKEAIRLSTFINSLPLDD